MKLLRQPSQIFPLYLFILPVFFLWVQSTNLKAAEEDPVEARLLSTVTATGLQETLLVGVHFKIQPGWKMYSPGPEGTSSLGYPPEFTWEGSQNVASIIPSWPPSKLFEEAGSLSHVYENEVVIPLTVDIKNPSQPVELSLVVDFAVCSNICLPLTKTFSLRIPVGCAMPTEDTQKILAYTAVPSSERMGPPYSYGVILIIAFLGGLILNFMPCVLPVLSLKLRSLVKNKKSKTHKHSDRLNFGGTLLGILSSFLVFALGAIALKSGGHVVGWGLHFQEPLFLVFMALLMVAFACNLFGFFEVELPQGAYQRIDSFLRGRTAHFTVFVEGYFSGIFATLLATPCTAPFLGTALGYALSRGSFEILTLFMALGVGFATPYWLGLLVPLQKLPLPKPGPWMIRLSQILGVGLGLTALWLVWIFAEEKGVIASLLLVGLLALVVLFFYLGHARPHLRKLTALPLLIAFALPFVFPDQDRERAVETKGPWKVFEESKISNLVSEGKIVFIDVTASWCVTCQVNKGLVLNTPGIQKLLTHEKVVALQGNLTQKNEKISAFLERYGRYGIPFNMVFGPKAPQGILLPELLTQSAVLEAFEKAGF